MARRTARKSTKAVPSEVAVSLAHAHWSHLATAMVAAAMTRLETMDLGGGAIAGIVIGVICGVAILSAIVRYLCKKGSSTSDQVELTSARP